MKVRVSHKTSSLITAIICFLVVLTVVGISDIGFSKQGDKKTVLLKSLGPARVGKAAPWFAAQDVNSIGKIINLNKVIKQPDTNKTVLVFFATWCKPCKEGLEILRLNQQKLEKAKIKVIIIDYQEESDQVQEFLKQNHLTAFTTIIDKFGQNSKSYGVAVTRKGGKMEASLPKTFVIGTDGKLLAIIGEEGEDYVERIIEAK